MITIRSLELSFGSQDRHAEPQPFPAPSPALHDRGHTVCWLKVCTVVLVPPSPQGRRHNDSGVHVLSCFYASMHENGSKCRSDGEDVSRAVAVASMASSLRSRSDPGCHRPCPPTNGNKRGLDATDSLSQMYDRCSFTGSVVSAMQAGAVQSPPYLHLLLCLQKPASSCCAQSWAIIFAPHPSSGALWPLAPFSLGSGYSGLSRAIVIACRAAPPASRSLNEPSV